MRTRKSTKTPAAKSTSRTGKASGARPNTVVEGRTAAAPPSPAPQPSTQPSTPQGTGDRPVLVILPGASGSLSKATVELLIPRLLNHYEVRIREGRWNISKPGAAANVDSVLQLCPRGEAAWFVMGHSFGNRVCCSMLAEQRFPVKPTKLILSGYPMYSDKGTDERVKLLQALPAECKVLCISGTKDEFLCKGPSGKSKSTAAVYEGVIDTMPCKGGVSLHMVANGGHSVIDTPKNQQDNAVSDVISWINEFTGVTPALH